MIAVYNMFAFTTLLFLCTFVSQLLPIPTWVECSTLSVCPEHISKTIDPKVSKLGIS